MKKRAGSTCRWRDDYRRSTKISTQELAKSRLRQIHPPNQATRSVLASAPCQLTIQAARCKSGRLPPPPPPDPTRCTFRTLSRRHFRREANTRRQTTMSLSPPISIFVRLAREQL